MSNKNRNPYVITKNVIGALATILVLGSPWIKIDEWLGLEYKTVYFVTCAVLSVVYIVCCWLSRKYYEKSDYLWHMLGGAAILVLCLLLLA